MDNTEQVCNSTITVSAEKSEKSVEGKSLTLQSAVAAGRAIVWCPMVADITKAAVSFKKTVTFML